MKKRHPNSHAREIALQALYQMDISDKSVEEVKELDWLENPRPDEKVIHYVHTALEGVHKNYQQDEIYIEKYSSVSPTQISKVIKAILHIGLWELRRKAWSHTIIIDDLIELIRQYDNEKSVPYVNGMLDTFYKKEISSNENPP